MSSHNRHRRSARIPNQCMYTFAKVIVLLVIPMITAIGAARADLPVVYHSPGDDGVMPGAPVEIPAGIESIVHLYIDGGSFPSPSDPCDQGSGDEVCAWDLVVEGQNGLDVLGFIADSDGFSHISGATLRFNGVAAIHGIVGPTKLGDVVVRGTSGGALQLLPSKSVNAALGIDTLPQATLVTVPEPGLLSTLLPGMVLLHACARRRRSTRSRKADSRGSEGAR